MSDYSSQIDSVHLLVHVLVREDVDVDEEDSLDENFKYLWVGLVATLTGAR